jgi:hypothetical protein
MHILITITYMLAHIYSELRAFWQPGLAVAILADGLFCAVNQPFVGESHQRRFKQSTNTQDQENSAWEQG